MRNSLTLIASLLLLVWGAPSASAVGEPRVASLQGEWVGGFARPEGQIFVVTHFRDAKEGTSGTIDVVDKTAGVWLIGKPLSKLELNPPRAHFELTNVAGSLSFEDKLRLMTSRADFQLTNPASHLLFEAQITNGVMTGIVEERGKKFPFRLDLLPKSDLSRYAGIYRVGSGHLIKIAPDIASLFSFDSQSGQMRLLLPRAEADFVCGPGLDLFPAQASIHFATNQLGQVTAMQWEERNTPTLAGIPVKLREERVSFKNGEITLSGTLVLPPTSAPHPAVILIHGSGPSIRDHLRVFADFFAMNGVAALAYDKRGAGTSTGDWRKAGFDDLAGDALAGLELLKKRPGINHDQIGLWGGSQGGWIVGLAAARSSNVAFIISVSGPGVTPEAQGAFMLEHRMKAAGFSEGDLRNALSLYRVNSRCSQTDSGWDELDAARKAAQSKPWYDDDYLGCGPPGVWRLIWNYDPVPMLRKVHCPVLAIFGELDPLVPVQKSAQIWKTALMEAGNQDVVVKVFPHAGHGINATPGGPPLAAYFAFQRDWLLKHVNISRD